MEDFNITIVAKKSVKGVFALASRTFFVSVLSAVTNLILTIFLDPATFGVFFVVSAIVVFLTYFQDIGLAGSLIQKKENPTIDELRVTFTVQQCLVLLFVIPGLFLSQYVAAFYQLDQAGVWLFDALLLSFFFSSLKTIPTILLERNLKFDKLVIPEIIENVVYNVTLIFFAWKGFGITSFTIAVLLRGIVGLVVIYIIQPWSVGILYRQDIFRHLISFGLPFQANSILALIKDNLLTLYIGKVLPFSEVGYIGFAQKVAFLPLRFIMDHVIKITFPSFSRLQHDKAALRTLMEKSLFIIAFLIFPIVVGLSMFSSDIIRFIPIADYQQKWNPQYLWLPIALFSLNALVASVTVPLTNFLNAVGKVKTTLKIMVFLTIFSWILTPVMILVSGYNGVAIASFVVAASALVAVYFVKQYMQFSFLKPIQSAGIAAFGMLVYIFLTHSIVTSFPFLVLEMLLSGGVYIGIVFLLAREQLVKTTRFAMQSIRNK